jgi:hypothetical protein
MIRSLSLVIPTGAAGDVEGSLVLRKPGSRSGVRASANERFLDKVGMTVRSVVVKGVSALSPS